MSWCKVRRSRESSLAEFKLEIPVPQLDNSLHQDLNIKIQITTTLQEETPQMQVLTIDENEFENIYQRNQIELNQNNNY